MTTNEIKAIIAEKIAGQGNQVDIGNGLAEVLNALADAIPEGGGGEPTVWHCNSIGIGSAVEIDRTGLPDPKVGDIVQDNNGQEVEITYLSSVTGGGHIFMCEEEEVLAYPVLFMFISE